MVPMMAQGHMIPMVDMARLLAERGALVTLFTTPLNASRIQAAIDRAARSGLPVRLVVVPFPCSEAGLPDSCESADLIPSRDLIRNFFDATILLRRPVEEHLREDQPRPDCIISDITFPWTRDLASELGIPRLTFNGYGCFSLLCTHNIMHHKVFDELSNDTEPFLVPGLPHRVELTKAQTPGFLTLPELEKFRNEVMEAESMTDGVVVNSFDGLEPTYTEIYRKAMGNKKVWTIGPVSLYNRDLEDRAGRGISASATTTAVVDRCLRWLDSMAPQSVVYVGFGSMVRFASPVQLVEIGSGLEASGRPFIWAAVGEKDEEWWVGFEERTRPRSLLIRGWAPQLAILSHPAVGVFVTHCGWNSTLEGIVAGVPMITCPQAAEQFLNEKLVVDVLGVGVSVGVQEEGVVVVGREVVEKAVEEVLGRGEVGTERRRRAEELGRMAREAMEVGGSSHVNMTCLIEEVMHGRTNAKG